MKTVRFGATLKMERTSAIKTELILFRNQNQRASNKRAFHFKQIHKLQ